MATVTKEELEEENAELRAGLQAIRDQIDDLLDGDEEDGDADEEA